MTYILGSGVFWYLGPGVRDLVCSTLSPSEQLVEDAHVIYDDIIHMPLPRQPDCRLVLTYITSGEHPTDLLQIYGRLLGHFSKAQYTVGVFMQGTKSAL